MKTIHCGDFFFGYYSINCKSSKKGILFYQSRPFAHVWQWQNNDFGNIGKWQINNDDVAIEMAYDGEKLFNNLEELIHYCDKWVKGNFK